MINSNNNTVTNHEFQKNNLFDIILNIIEELKISIVTVLNSFVNNNLN